MNKDDLTIPDFLRLTDEQRKQARDSFKEEVKTVVFHDPLKPVSMSVEEWERIKQERRKKKPVEAPKKKVIAKLDTTGMRWDGRKGKWVKDQFAHLCIASPTPVKPLRSPPRGSASSFGIPEGTNRDRLAKAMAKRLGEMVTLKEWSKLVYGKENEGPCFNVMGGFIRDLKKRKLRFEIIRDKDEKGQVTFGLFELE